MTSKSETVPAVSSIVTSSTVGSISISISGTARSSSSFGALGSPWSSKFMSITAIHLKEHNYPPWAKSTEVFLRANKQHWYLTDDSPDSTGPIFADWDAEDSHIRLCMWNSIETTFNSSLMYMDTVKQMWNRAKKMFSDVGNL